MRQRDTTDQAAAKGITIRIVFLAAILGAISPAPSLAQHTMVDGTAPPNVTESAVSVREPSGSMVPCAAIMQELATLRVRHADANRRKAALRDRLDDLAFALQRLARQPPEAVLTMPESPLDTVRAMALIRHLSTTAKADMARIKAELLDLERLQDEIHTLEARPETTETTHHNGISLTSRGSARRSPPKDRTLSNDQPPAGDHPDTPAVRTRIPATKPRAPDWPSACLSHDSQSMHAIKGTLIFPASGQIVERFGITGTSGLRARGLTLQTDVDAEVVAPYGGIVHYAGLFSDYGPMIIIQHGKGLHTLLAGLGRVDVRTGQDLLAGEPIGSMGGNSAASVDTLRHLYIEMREDGKPVNPLAWLSTERGSTKR